MGRPQQRERERKKAAKTCQRLDNLFLPSPVAKKRKTCSADDRTQPHAAQDKEISVEIDADKVEDLGNMPVMQEKEERTIVSIHDHPSHSDEDEDHQVCEVEEALETEINTDDGALTAAFGSTPTSTSRQALSTLLQHPTTSVIGLVPAVICTRDMDIEDALKMYSNDLPSPELVRQEIKHWKLRYEKMPEDKRPASVATAIKECDPMYFPNLRTLLQIACTLPVTSCECERSASTLRRLHNYMRASMGQERMTALALMHIHYNSDIDLNEVVNIYCTHKCIQGEWNWNI